MYIRYKNRHFDFGDLFELEKVGVEEEKKNREK